MFPVYFATQDIDGKRLHVKAGQPFPPYMQTKGALRGLGPALGVPDADTRPFADLPYVTVIDAHTADAAAQVCELNLPLPEATKRLRGKKAA